MVDETASFSNGLALNQTSQLRYNKKKNNLVSSIFAFDDGTLATALPGRPPESRLNVMPDGVHDDLSVPGTETI